MSNELIDERSQIHVTAEIGSNVRIGPWCSIGKNVTIDEGSILESHIVKTIEFFNLAPLARTRQIKSFRVRRPGWK